MEESTQPTSSGSSATKYIIPAVVVGVILIAAVVLFSNKSQQNPQIESAQTTPSGPEARATQASPTDVMQSMYKDGTYSATGHYVSPGGPRDVDVTITLSKGVITDATFTGHATDPNSMRFQGEFRDNFKAQVVGKNIDDVAVTKVSGSSLSPKGFMDALGQIKTEAHA